MAQFFINEADYTEIYTYPEDATKENNMEDGDEISLIRIEVISCTHFKCANGKLVAQSVSFPLGGLDEA